MPTNVAIRLNVEGGAEVRRLFEDTGSAGQSAFQKIGAAADQAGAATDRQTARYQRLAQAAREAESQARAQANVNTLLGVRDASSGAARASASVFEEAARAEAEALRRTAEARTTTIRNTVAGWRDLGTAGAATLANIEAGRRLGSMAGPTAANQNGAGRRLRNDEVTNLMYQGGDIAAQLGSGSSLSMIAMQQGPQIAQIFAGPGGASVKGAFAQAGEAVSAFVRRIGLVGAAFGGATLAAGVSTAALLSYRSAQREVELSIAGVGRASGVTLGQINALAQAQAGSLRLSTGATRELAATFVATGRIGADVLPKAIGATRGFAGFLGVEDQECCSRCRSYSCRTILSLIRRQMPDRPSRRVVRWRALLPSSAWCFLLIMCRVAQGEPKVETARSRMSQADKTSLAPPIA